MVANCVINGSNGLSFPTWFPFHTFLNDSNQHVSFAGWITIFYMFIYTIIIVFFTILCHFHYKRKFLQKCVKSFNHNQSKSNNQSNSLLPRFHSHGTVLTRVKSVDTKNTHVTPSNSNSNSSNNVKNNKHTSHPSRNKKKNNNDGTTTLVTLSQYASFMNHLIQLRKIYFRLFCHIIEQGCCIGVIIRLFQISFDLKRDYYMQPDSSYTIRENFYNFENNNKIFDESCKQLNIQVLMLVLLFSWFLYQIMISFYSWFITLKFHNFMLRLFNLEIIIKILNIHHKIQFYRYLNPNYNYSLDFSDTISPTPTPTNIIHNNTTDELCFPMLWQLHVHSYCQSCIFLLINLIYLIKAFEFDYDGQDEYFNCNSLFVICLIFNFLSLLNTSMEHDSIVFEQSMTKARCKDEKVSKIKHRRSISTSTTSTTSTMTTSTTTSGDKKDQKDKKDNKENRDNNGNTDGCGWCNCKEKNSSNASKCGLKNVIKIQMLKFYFRFSDLSMRFICLGLIWLTFSSYILIICIFMELILLTCLTMYDTISYRKNRIKINDNALKSREQFHRSDFQSLHVRPNTGINHNTNINYADDSDGSSIDINKSASLDTSIQLRLEAKQHSLSNSNNIIVSPQSIPSTDLDNHRTKNENKSENRKKNDTVVNNKTKTQKITTTTTNEKGNLTRKKRRKKPKVVNLMLNPMFYFSKYIKSEYIYCLIFVPLRYSRNKMIFYFSVYRWLLNLLMIIMVTFFNFIPFLAKVQCSNFHDKNVNPVSIAKTNDFLCEYYNQDSSTNSNEFSLLLVNNFGLSLFIVCIILIILFPIYFLLILSRFIEYENLDEIYDFDFNFILLAFYKNKKTKGKKKNKNNTNKNKKDKNKKDKNKATYKDKDDNKQKEKQNENENENNNVVDDAITRSERSILDVDSFTLFAQASAVSLSMLSMSNLESSTSSTTDTTIAGGGDELQWNDKQLEQVQAAVTTSANGMKPDGKGLTCQGKYSVETEYCMRKSMLSMIRRGDIIGIFQVLEFGISVDNSSGIYRRTACFVDWHEISSSQLMSLLYLLDDQNVDFSEIHQINHNIHDNDTIREINKQENGLMLQLCSHNQDCSYWIQYLLIEKQLFRKVERYKPLEMICIACYYGNLNILKSLVYRLSLQTFVSSLTTTDVNGNLPIHWVCCERSLSSALCFLLFFFFFCFVFRLDFLIFLFLFLILCTCEPQNFCCFLV